MEFTELFRSSFVAALWCVILAINWTEEEGSSSLEGEVVESRRSVPKAVG